MMEIKEFERVSGIDRATIRYYCSEGLLTPSRTGEGKSNNRRLYDEADLACLQQICIYRKLNRSIAEIKAIMNAPDYDPLEALDTAVEAVEKEIRHLQVVALLARVSQVMGTTMFSFGTLSDEGVDAISEMFGSIPEFDKIVSLSGEEQKRLFNLWGDTYRRFGELRDDFTEAAFIQAMNCVDDCYAQLESAISGTRHSVLCVLSLGFGGDGFLKLAADRVGGDGTAEFMSSCFMIAWTIKMARVVVPAVNDLFQRELSGEDCSEAAGVISRLISDFCGAGLPEHLKKAIAPSGGGDLMEFVREIVDRCASSDLAWGLTGLGEDEAPTEEVWSVAITALDQYRKKGEAIVK